ncbi:MAG TPA: RNA polymerase sigma factor [Microthrixaceae bacterium]|nr:RNA polymerase sigma factor [Microthrixaceae bacterium]
MSESHGKAATQVPASDDREDARLWPRARDGDPEAFGELFDRYADAVYRYAFVRLHSADSAEEIVSIVFSEAWRQRDRIELLDESLRPWLLGVARNQCNRHHTMRLRGANYRPDLIDLYEADHAEDSAAALDAPLELQRMIVAIGDLPEGQQEVLTLCVWGGLNHEQIAAQLGVSVGTVKSRLNRARTRLERIRGTKVPATTSPVGVIELHESITEGDQHVR